MQVVSKARVRTVLGTMGVGGTLDESKARKALDIFSKAGFKEVDTAIMYQGGKTEKVLGNIGTGTNPAFSLAVKVNPWFSLEKKSTTTEPAKGLRKEAILCQIQETLTNLKTTKVRSFPFPEKVS